MKQRRLTISLVTIALLFVVSLQLPFQDLVQGSELIGDNFNDMNYDGWYTFGTYGNSTDGKWYPLGAGNFSAADKTLKVTPAPTGNATHFYLNMAYTNSTIAYGTWSFDLYYVDNPEVNWPNRMAILFMTDSPYSAASSGFPLPYMTAGYILELFKSSPPVLLLMRIVGEQGIYIDENNLESDLGAWKNRWTHFDITRNSTGYFNVYTNGTLRLSGLDSTYSSTNYFQFVGQSGQAIDNVAIYDYIVPPPPTPEPTTTTTTPDLTTPMIAIGAIELIILIVLVILYFRRRS